MFTGLIEETGRVVKIQPGGVTRLEISASEVVRDVGVGNSIAVNGTCLTVGEAGDDRLVFDDVTPETLRRTTLGGLGEGDLVNLERAMDVGSRFGGHIVQGHVDGVGEVVGVTPDGGAWMWEFTAPEAVLRYTVEKGSVCVDGISLTVASLNERSFAVSILPQTREKTNLRELEVGDRVNLEADVIGKYVERLMQPWNARDVSIPKGERDAV